MTPPSASIPVLIVDDEASTDGVAHGRLLQQYAALYPGLFESRAIRVELCDNAHWVALELARTKLNAPPRWEIVFADVMMKEWQLKKATQRSATCQRSNVDDLILWTGMNESTGLSTRMVGVPKYDHGGLAILDTIRNRRDLHDRMQLVLVSKQAQGVLRTRIINALRGHEHWVQFFDKAVLDASTSAWSSASRPEVYRRALGLAVRRRLESNLEGWAIGREFPLGAGPHLLEIEDAARRLRPGSAVLVLAETPDERRALSGMLARLVLGKTALLRPALNSGSADGREAENALSSSTSPVESCGYLVNDFFNLHPQVVGAVNAAVERFSQERKNLLLFLDSPVVEGAAKHEMFPPLAARLHQGEIKRFELPPLRERPQDVTAYASSLLAQINEQGCAQGCVEARFTDGSAAVWPSGKPWRSLVSLRDFLTDAVSSAVGGLLTVELLEEALKAAPNHYLAEIEQATGGGTDQRGRPESRNAASKRSHPSTEQRPGPIKIEFVAGSPARVLVNGDELRLMSNRNYAMLFLLAEKFPANATAGPEQKHLLAPFIETLKSLPERCNILLNGNDERALKRCEDAHSNAFSTGKAETPIASILSDFRKKDLQRKVTGLTPVGDAEKTAAAALMEFLPRARDAFQLRNVDSTEVKLLPIPARSV